MRHEIDLGFAQFTDSRKPIVPTLTVRDSRGKVIHRYELDEHNFVRMLSGGVVRADDTMSDGEPEFETYEDDGRLVFTSRAWPWVIADGTSSRFQTVTINAHDDDRELSIAEARRYAAAILAAADEAERGH